MFVSLVSANIAPLSHLKDDFFGEMNHYSASLIRYK